MYLFSCIALVRPVNHFYSHARPKGEHRRAGRGPLSCCEALVSHRGLVPFSIILSAILMQTDRSISIPRNWDATKLSVTLPTPSGRIRGWYEPQILQVRYVVRPLPCFKITVPGFAAAMQPQSSTVTRSGEVALAVGRPFSRAPSLGIPDPCWAAAEMVRLASCYTHGFFEG